MGVIDRFVDTVYSGYFGLKEVVPQNILLGVNMFFFAVLIAVSAFVIWKFYNTLSRKNFITLDLKQYDWSEHPTMNKFGATIFYFIEYIVLMPILILVWFAILTVILLVLAGERGAIQLLQMSGAMILAIRILAYYNEEISKDLAKLFPFIALSVFLLTPGAFEPGSFLSNLTQIPELIGDVMHFLIVILSVEIILRFSYTLFELASGREEVGDDNRK
jgi:hypothetical protein